MLTDKYLSGIPEDSRAGREGTFLKPDFLTEENLANIRALNEIAKKRGQSLAQTALMWNLRHPQVASVLIGASSPAQIRENVAALSNRTFSDEELAEIDKYAKEGNINLWSSSSDIK